MYLALAGHSFYYVDILFFFLVSLWKRDACGLYIYIYISDGRCLGRACRVVGGAVSALHCKYHLSLKYHMLFLHLDPTVVNIGYLETGLVTSYSYTISNYGLIRADNVALQLPTNHPFLKFNWTDPGSLEANSSVIVVVHVTGGHARRRSTSGCYIGLGSEFPPFSFSIYIYVCVLVLSVFKLS